MDAKEIFPEVKVIVADVLAVEEEEVKLDSFLIDDLGGESIDFLDLVFRLEKKFSVKIPRGQIEKDARGALTEEEFAKDGVLTEKGLEALKAYLPEVPAEKFKSGFKANAIPTLFTVETFCRLVINAKKSA